MKPIRKIKAKHYTREILKYLLVGGVIMILGGSPSFGYKAWKQIMGSSKITKRRSYDAFHYLQKKGLLELQRVGEDVTMTLTEKGKRQAGKFQIDDLAIMRPKRWDGKWRIVMFDIPEASKLVRNIFRRKLKEFGFVRIQQSVWIFPFECKEEIGLLREFLGADKKQIRFAEVTHIENDEGLRKHFNI